MSRTFGLQIITQLKSSHQQDADRLSDAPIDRIFSHYINIKSVFPWSAAESAAE
jgi:hypothetical protein